ncbi:MAG: MBL fold metallo-hydrolase [Candidatus Binatia bacterium]|jgi:7,8-dihydropterin-6-yl-methyl-4-(beta-D-ribofuranosyl)aminobenzene 5'-phosphate synthase
MPLKEVDRVEILTILDNSIDLLLPGAQNVQRLPFSPDVLTRENPIAEHGFAALVTVHKGNTSASLLFDTGLSKTGLVHNMDVLGLKAGDLQAIVLSHGHADHTQGLPRLVDRLGKRRMPLVLHPDAFLQRKLVLPDGLEVNLPPPDRQSLSQNGVEFAEERGPSLLLDDLVLVTGQVSRATSFEVGLPLHHAFIDGSYRPDPYLYDDQAIVVHVRDKGLVVLTGCGHAGVINTVQHARQLTGIEKTAAVMGGFHLSGLFFEQAIEPTVAALKQIDPGLIVPAHCTGWKATHRIAREFPDAFIQNSVGTRFLL